MGAVNEGAVYKFITKPWNDEDLRLTVSLALQQYVLIKENRKLKDLTQKQQKKIKGYAALLNENRGAPMQPAEFCWTGVALWQQKAGLGIATPVQKNVTV